jgi:hypothetical protein
MAAAADKAAQRESTRRNDPSRSANIASNGPETRRVSIAAASRKPICWGARVLVSKNFGQKGDATPNAAYKAT